MRALGLLLSAKHLAFAALAALALPPAPAAAADKTDGGARQAAPLEYEGPPEELATLRQELRELEAQALELTGKVDELSPRWGRELSSQERATLLRERGDLRPRLGSILEELESKSGQLSDKRNRWEDQMIRMGASELLRVGEVPKGAYNLLADAAAVDQFNKRIRAARSAGLLALQAEEEAYGRYAAAQARRLRMLWAASGSAALLAGGLAAFAWQARGRAERAR